MPSELVYRLADREDAIGIANLHAASWRLTYRGNFRDEYLDGDVFSERQRVWRRRLSAPQSNQCVCVALDRSAVVGFDCVYGAHDQEWGSFIDNLHVAGESQRRGIGATLMQRAGLWLAERYADVGVYLFVWVHNPAQWFYERLGGRRAGMVEIANPGGGVGQYLRYAWDRPDRLWRGRTGWTSEDSNAKARLRSRGN